MCDDIWRAAHRGDLAEVERLVGHDRACSRPEIASMTVRL
jgi:hypothetical protein